MMYMVARAERSDDPRRGTPAERTRNDADLRRKTRIEPSAADAESTRLLANEARDALRARGIPNVMIERLAGRYVAEGLGTSVDEFVEWAENRARGSRI